MKLSTVPTGISKWTAFCIQNYKITILIIFALIIGGVWGIFSMEKQDFPNIPANFIIVQATYPQASPEDVERDILVPLEAALSEIDGVTKIRSSAYQSGGNMFLELGDFTAGKEKASKAEEIIHSTPLPSSVEASAQLIEASGPSMTIALVSDTLPIEKILEEAPALQQQLLGASDEIREVTISPKDDFEILIELDTQKIQEHNISLQEIQGTLQSALITIPGGVLTTPTGQTQPIAIDASLKSMDDIRDLKVQGTPLAEIATITRQLKQQNELSIAGYTLDGQTKSSEAVYLNIFKKDKGDITKISKSIHDVLTKYQHNGMLSEDVNAVVLYDTAPDIQTQISTLITNGAIGLVVILIVLLFVVNLRAAIVVSLILPLAFLTGLFILPLVGYTLNILTLFALILTLGILVDNAIVIAEGIVHNIQKGMDRKTAAISSIQQFGPAVTAATLTTVIVFIPFAKIGGIVGEFMKYIPYTIIIMLVSSYVLAIIITPLLAVWILRTHSTETKLKTWQKALIIPWIVRLAQTGLNNVQEKYRQMMTSILAKKSRRITTIIVSLVLMIISFGYFAGKLKFEQFPSNDGQMITVSAEFSPQSSTQQQREILEKIGDQVITLPYFESYFLQQGSLFAIFAPPDERDDHQSINQIADQLDNNLTGVRNEIGPKGSLVVNTAGVGPIEDSYNITVEVQSNDSEARKTVLDDFEKVLRDTGNVEKIFNQNEDATMQMVRIVYKKDELEKRGITTTMVSGIIGSVYGKQPLGTLTHGAENVSDQLTLATKKADQQSIDDLNALIILPPQTPQAQPTKLSDIATAEIVTVPQSIDRQNRKRTSVLKVRLIDTNKQKEVEQLLQNHFTDEQLNNLKIQRDDIQFGGAFADTQTDQEKLLIVFIIAILLVYIVLVYQFRSYGQPLIILLTIPIGLTGVFPGLVLVGSTLNMISGLGVVALVGIVVNDAIVFIDYYNQKRKTEPEKTLQHQLAATGYARFKPILTTSLTTIAGILPLTIRDPFWVGLGTSIVAGLLFSTIGTLITIPVLLHWFTRKKKKSNA